MQSPENRGARGRSGHDRRIDVYGRYLWDIKVNAVGAFTTPVSQLQTGIVACQWLTPPLSPLNNRAVWSRHGTTRVPGLAGRPLLRVRLTSVTIQDFIELLRANGLRKASVHAGLQAPLTISLQGTRSQRDHGQAPSGAELFCPQSRMV
jgi:hypothetical protein